MITIARAPPGHDGPSGTAQAPRSSTATKLTLTRESPRPKRHEPQSPARGAAPSMTLVRRPPAVARRSAPACTNPSSIPALAAAGAAHDAAQADDERYRPPGRSTR
ncbi:hypothetical protein ACFPM0_37315 [Pseudonocardia sulfidoxydans]|uniref:hypothetical protein n=1 Tax=Pseudonocardia sulfidoxydans TaxID=54011 RepID=UPI003620ADD5